MAQTVLSLVDSEVVSLEIRVDEEDWVGQFDHIEVWRSVAGDAGPYDLMTSVGWSPAKLPEDAGDPTGASGSLASIQGKTLEIVLNEQVTLSYTFPGAVALTYGEAASQLNAAFPQYIQAGVDLNGRFFISTLQAGGTASLRVPTSDASSLLGLEGDVIVYGKEASPVLVSGITKYYFKDFYGKKAYFYKTRLVDIGTGAHSEFSTPIPGDRGDLGITPENVILGYLSLVDLNGRVVKNKQVVVYNAFLGDTQEGYDIIGTQVSRSTNEDGYVEFELIRGMSVDVSIPGTALMRRIKVPTDPAVLKFRLLDPSVGEDDAYASQRINFPYAERRSL